MSKDNTVRSEDDAKAMQARFIYELESVHEVDGRQGIAREGDFYYVSGSTTLSCYDKDFNLINTNTEPFTGIDLEVNHFGDIDVFNNEIYAGVEYFNDGAGTNIQIAVYDAKTLKLKRLFPFSGGSGQKECSGIAVDYDHGYVYMCSWIDDESSSYLYRYDLNDGSYLGRIHMNPYPQWIQGIAYYDGDLYVTCDDGNADDPYPDHMYRIRIKDESNADTILERTFDDVIRQGEIEGLYFDKDHDQFLLLYNRGARIILGMPSGFYEGYDHEIREVYIYNLKKR